MVSPQQRRRLVFVGSLLIAGAVGCADSPPSVPFPEARAREDSAGLGLLSELEPLLDAVPDPCDPSSSECPSLISVSPGYFQGADQPEPIELTFTGPVGQIKVSGRGAIYCVGTFGTIVGYDADGTRIASVDLTLSSPIDCGSDKITYGAHGTLLATRPIARLVILPMSPLTFSGSDWVGRAQATYTVRYGVGWLTPAPGPLGITAPLDVAANAAPGVCAASVDPGAGTVTGASSIVGSREDGARLHDLYPLGVTTITWTATAADGQTATATQTVTVSDITPPSFGTPSNVRVNNDPGLTSAVVTLSVPRVKTNNCPGVTVAGVRSDGLALTDPYPVGTTVITWTATDASGNTASVTQTVKVLDALALQKLSAPSSIVEGSGYTISVSGPQPYGDRGPLVYAFDCGLGEGYVAWISAKSTVCPVQRDQRAEPITVGVKARDALGYEREITRQVVVKNAKPVVTFAATSATTINVGETVSFSGSFTDKGLDDAPWTWSVSWGDATPGANGTTSVQGDVGQFSHAYAKAGTFGAYLKVVDKDGGASVVKKVTVTVVQPAPAP